MFTFAFFIFIAFASMPSYYMAYEIKKGREVEEEYRKAMLHQAQNLRAYKKELRMYGSRIDNALHELGELNTMNEKEINPRGGQY